MKHPATLTLALSLLAAAACASSSPGPVAAPCPVPTAAAEDGDATAMDKPPLAPVTPTPGRAEAMARLSFMNGVWVGAATGTNRDGSQYSVTQTERMGPMLGGDVIVIEGRGYKDDKTTGFNAFAVVSFDAMANKYEIRSYAQGFAGTFELKPTDDGYVWEVPAGPKAIMRFTATVKGETWREVGELVVPGQPPVKSFEMNLKRVGDTDWPLATPVRPDAGE